MPRRRQVRLRARHDDETGLTTITEGILGCAAYSLSRIKAILRAGDDPLGSFNLDIRLPVQVERRRHARGGWQNVDNEYTNTDQ